MKRVLAVVLLAVILTGCGGVDTEMDRAMTLRQQLLNAAECSFQTVVTADYGEQVYTFSMDCTAGSDGAVRFTVTDPESIAGITGELSGEGGKLTFDDTAVAFDMLADGQISPVSAPWVLVKTLRGGYLAACAREGELLRLSIDDSYEADALRLDIWLDSEDHPVNAEILFDGRRILSMTVENFSIV